MNELFPPCEEQEFVSSNREVDHVLEKNFVSRDLVGRQVLRSDGVYVEGQVQSLDLSFY